MRNPTVVPAAPAVLAVLAALATAMAMAPATHRARDQTADQTTDQTTDLATGRAMTLAVARGRITAMAMIAPILHRRAGPKANACRSRIVARSTSSMIGAATT